jgi:hypothetical protein
MARTRSPIRRAPGASVPLRVRRPRATGTTTFDSAARACSDCALALLSSTGMTAEPP